MHVDGRQVGQNREQSLAVIEHDGVAQKVQVAREHHLRGVGRLDRRPGRTQKIGAAVLAARLAVVDAARAEPAVGGIGHGTDEPVGPS